MPAPVQSTIVRGKVYDASKVIVANATVSLTHSNGTLSTSSNTNGEYQLNLGDLTSWSEGDSVTLTATASTKGTITNTITISKGTNSQNMDLAETSSIDYAPKETNQFNLVMATLTSFDGEKITRANPLPVTSSEIDFLNNPQYDWVITRGDGQPDTETITFGNGDRYRRTFSYDSNGIMTRRTRWVKV